MTARALDSIGSVGGPRCCKRDSFLAILAAVDFAREHLGVEMERTVPVCSYSALNNQCIGRRCPFFGGGPLNPRRTWFSALARGACAGPPLWRPSSAHPAGARPRTAETAWHTTS